MADKPIRYCRHLQERLVLRKIEDHIPRQIMQNPESLFHDTETGYRIAVATLAYLGRRRPMMVAFEHTEDEVVAITIHPIDPGDIDRRVQSGRWVAL